MLFRLLGTLFELLIQLFPLFFGKTLSINHFIVYFSFNNNIELEFEKGQFHFKNSSVAYNNLLLVDDLAVLGNVVELAPG